MKLNSLIAGIVFLAATNSIASAESTDYSPAIRGLATPFFRTVTKDGEFVCGLVNEIYVPGKIRANGRFVTTSRLIKRLKVLIRRAPTSEYKARKRKLLKKHREYLKLASEACLFNANSGSSSSSSSSSSAIGIIASNPPHGAIDARTPGDPKQESPGWREVELTFDGDVSGVKPQDFSILTRTDQNVEGTKEVVQIELLSATSLRLHLNSPMEVLSRMAVYHNPSRTGICLGFIPGDINGSGIVSVTETPGDHDAMFGSGGAPHPSTRPLWSVDLNRNGVYEPTDNLTFVEIMSDPRFLNNPNLPIICPGLP